MIKLNYKYKNLVIIKILIYKENKLVDEANRQ